MYVDRQDQYAMLLKCVLEMMVIVRMMDTWLMVPYVALADSVGKETVQILNNSVAIFGVRVSSLYFLRRKNREEITTGNLGVLKYLYEFSKN